MANPHISFRLSKYQIARGLKIIRLIEPDHSPVSVSQLVKTIYIDYLAKTSLQSVGDVNDDDIAEVESLLSQPSKKLTFDTFKQSLQQAEVIKNEPETNSEISTVSDFAPPEEWTK